MPCARGVNVFVHRFTNWSNFARLMGYDSNFLMIRHVLEKLSSSRPARKLAVVVLCSVFTAQLLLLLPLMWVKYHQAVDAQIEQERSSLQSIIQHSPPETFLNPQGLINSALVGLVVTDAAGNPVITQGELPEFEDLTQNSNNSGSNRSGSIDVLWFLQSDKGRVLAAARINTAPIYQSSMEFTITLVLASLLISVVAALVTLWGTNRSYITPVAQLTDKLRDSRENSQGRVPDKIEYAETEDLNGLAEEYNNLIEAQQRAARQVKVKQQYLEFAAHHDPLTHLPNRLMFEDKLKRTVATAVENDEPFVVFLVDLDNFKFFNDQYGHLVGDKMVAEIGNRLQSMMHDIDMVARLDGDEFVVIQRNIQDRTAAEEIARRVMNIATAPYEYRGFTLKAAVSVGISCFPKDVHGDQDEEMMGEEIVNNAAVALQEAKSNGKNQYQLFNEKMRSRLTARIRLEQDLKLALQENQFEVYYQPKIDIQTRQVTGAEALVRWKHPTDGFISPEVFVPVAEEAGMIIELGEWILRTACRETRKLQQLGFSNLNIAVNISTVQFTDGNLLPMVSKALKDTMLPPKFLELEITESAVMHDPEEVINSLHELSRFGLGLAIDDFGTGYSSLAYLKRFPVHTLKIDRAFITDISSDSDDVAIVEAVLGLGKHFNMKVVAEGVEDEDQLKFLSTQGCDIAQGYFISRPMPVAVYLAWLRKWPHGMYTPNADNVDKADNGDDKVSVLKFGT